MKIAVIGSGIAGLTAAYRLAPGHEVTVFEARSRVGGHTHTIDVEMKTGSLPVDTGFIVYNERNYPRFCSLLDEWGVETRASNMSFGIRHEGLDLEYSGSSIAGLFAQRSNLIRPSHYKFLLEILRFGRLSKAELVALDDKDPRTVGDFLASHQFSDAFRLNYLLPMASAIWSSSHTGIEGFPLATFFRFFENHGLLDLRNRPQWRVIAGGSARYIDALRSKRNLLIQADSPVTSVTRRPSSVELTLGGGHKAHFDALVIACHSDQALKLLADPSPAEVDVLNALPYSANSVILHTDESVLPRSRRAWAAWNYWTDGIDPDALPAVTYSMNTLQGFKSDQHYLVTLNRDEAIDPQKILRRLNYSHPQCSVGAVAAQRRRGEISGLNRTVYCGAYWGYGFHEDGVRSAEQAVSELDSAIDSRLSQSA